MLPADQRLHADDVLAARIDLRLVVHAKLAVLLCLAQLRFERDRLDADSACINKTKGKNVFVVGHTDTSGTEEYNIALSERRAQAAADYLARLGTDPARMQVVPNGETEPTGLGDDKDRRVEFQWH